MKTIYSCQLLLTIFLSLIIFKILINPSISGDGREYLAMSQSIANHLSPELRKSDYLDLLSDPTITESDRNMIRDLQPVGSGAAPQGGGYFLSHGHKYYSYHFWIYSLLNVPAFILCRALGLNTINSFLITNLILLLIAAITILNSKRYTGTARLFMLLFLWLGGVTLYVNWTSPETFTFSLLAIGGMLASNKKPFAAAFITALAAQQNPPVGITSVAFLAAGLHFGLVKYGHIKSPSMIKAIGTLIILMMSPVFYYANYRTANLISANGYTSTNLISLDRLISFYFDLNQGMIVGMPGLVVLFFGSLVYLLFRRKLPVKQFVVSIALGILCLLLAVPCLSTVNFNSGADVMSRYALWVGVPLAFAIGEAIRIATLAWKAIAITIYLAAQFVAFHLSGSLFHGYSYVELSPGARWMLAHAPSLYNPIPEILIERGIGIDGGMQFDNTYYYVIKGSIRKILFHQPPGSLWLPACKIADKQHIVGSELGWAYISLPRGSCKSGLPNGLYALRQEEGKPGHL